MTFTNTTGAAVTGVELSIAVPAGWTIRRPRHDTVNSSRHGSAGFERERDLHGDVRAGSLERRPRGRRPVDGRDRGKAPKLRSRRCAT